MTSFQYRISKLLQIEGFLTFPIRDADSDVDIIAIRNGKVSAYRTKAHGNIYTAERQKLATLAKDTGMKVIIVKERGDHSIYFDKVI